MDCYSAFKGGEWLKDLEAWEHNAKQSKAII